MNICERTTCLWGATVQTVRCWAIDTEVLTRDTHKMKQDKVEHNIYRVSVCEGMRCVNEKERKWEETFGKESITNLFFSQCDVNVLLVICMYFLGFKAIL